MENLKENLGRKMRPEEVAEYLEAKGKKVTVIEMLKKLGANVQEMVANVVIPEIQENNNISIHLKTKIEEVQGNKLIGTQKKKPIEIEFDDLVIATGAKPNNSLEAEIKAKVPKLKKIGDCKKTRKIVDAVKDGYKIALKI